MKRRSAATGSSFGARVLLSPPSGEILAKASVDREEIIFADVEWKRVDEHRTHWPFLRDRRIDAYAGSNNACSTKLSLKRQG